MSEVQALSWLLVGTPFAGAALLAAMPRWQVAAWITFASAAASLVLAVVLALDVAASPTAAPGALPLPGGLPGALPSALTGAALRVDALAAFGTVLTTFVGLSTAWHLRACLAADVALRRLPAPRAKGIQVLFQITQGSVLLALLAAGPGLAWLAMLVAVLTLAFVAALPGTEVAIAAARSAFLPAAAALALAFLGLAVLVLVAQPDMGWTTDWAGLAGRSGGVLPRSGFVFVLAGCGALAGLVPAVPWLPAAGAAGSATVPVILSSGLSNAALLLLLRLRAALGWDVPIGDVASGVGLMALLGLVSILLGALLLWHRPGSADAGRWLSFAGIVQAGAAAYAFALGGTALDAGLTYMAAATLARTGAAQCLGRAGLHRGGTAFSALAGLNDAGRGLGFLVLLCLAALAGLPPAGVFTGQVLLVMEAARHSPVVAVLLAGVFLVAGWALLAGGAWLAFGSDPDSESPNSFSLGYSPRQLGPPPGRWDLAGVWLHLLALLLLGLLLPAPVAAFLRQAAASVR